MIYLRKLAHLFEHQHLVLTGSFEGSRWVGMTDRRLTLIERHGVEAETNEMIYVDAHEQGTIDPLQIGEDLDANGCPILPKGTVTIPAGQGAEKNGSILPPRKAYDLVNQTLDGTYPFTFPAGIENCLEQWLAFRFCGGRLLIRSAEEYQELDQGVEYEFACEYSDIEDGTCFAVKTELIRICKELACDMVMSVKKADKGAVYIGIRTPDLACIYFCKPLNIEENLPMTEETAPTEENPGAPDNVEEKTSEGPPAEQGGETPPETEPTEGGGGETPADPKPQPEPVEPVDVVSLLDGEVAERYRNVRDTVRTELAELEKLRKVITKEVRKSAKSSADPAEVKGLKAEVKGLKAELAAAVKQRDAAKKALKDVL